MGQTCRATLGNALASLLLGEVNAASLQISDKISTRATYWGFFAQDDWRLTRNLTLNYGFRYDLELPRRAVGNTMNSFDPLAINPVSGTPGVVTFAGVNGTPERAFATDKNNLGPRFGFAYRLPWQERLWKPYFRFEHIGIDPAEVVFATVPDQRILGAGFGAGVVDDHQELEILVRRRRQSLPPDAVGEVDRLALVGLQDRVLDIGE